MCSRLSSAAWNFFIIYFVSVKDKLYLAQKTGYKSFNNTNNMIKNNKESWLKNALRKIFTNQKLGIAITIIGTLIAYFEWKDGRKDAIEDKYEKLLESEINYHDKLTLRLGDFDINDQSVINVDIVTKDYNSIGLIPFRIGIFNGGDISAINVKGIINGDLPNHVWAVDPFEDEIKNYDNKFKINSITPKAMYGVMLMYFIAVKKQGDGKSFTVSCTCDNKRNPIMIKFNLRCYKFPSVDNYVNYLLSTVCKSKDELSSYWNGDDNFVLFLSTEEINNETNIKDSFEKVFLTEHGIKLKSLQ